MTATPPTPESVTSSTPIAAPAGGTSLAAQAPVALAPTAEAVTTTTPVNAPAGAVPLD